MPQTIDASDYRDKVAGGWLGKNIGGTLGGPYEGHTGLLHLYYYDPVPTEAIPNDDLELQMVWLHLLRKKGIYLAPGDFAPCWLENIKYHIAEYYMAQRNLFAGLKPPVTGAFNNWWRRGMGATIRSEIWAMLAPGMPDVAAAYAYLDASVDHAAEGVHGEMFFAAMESAAFVENDPRELIAIGLKYLPPQSAVRDAVELVQHAHAEAVPPWMARHRICASLSHPADFTYVPTNVGFIVLGLLYGADFGDAICQAVNCGYDTDCTGATLGALLGIGLGSDRIPAKWKDPIGDKIVVGPGVSGISAPATLDELTAQVCELGKNVMAETDRVRRHLRLWTELPFLAPEPAKMAGPWPQHSRVALEVQPDFAVRLDYVDEPAIGHGQTKQAVIVLENYGAAVNSFQIELTAPQALELSQDGRRFAQNLDTTIDVPPGAQRTLRVGLRVVPGQALEPANPLKVGVRDRRGSVCECHAVFMGNSLWLTTGPVPATDEKTIERYEKNGKIPANEQTTPVSLATDSLEPLLPEPGYVIFAQTTLKAASETRAIILANNTGPVSIFFNGKLVAEKKHRLWGLMPSAHLQSMTSTHLPGNAGYAEVQLKKGENTVMLKLTGTDYPQDTCFHLMKIEPTKERAIFSFKPLTDVSNTGC